MNEEALQHSYDLFKKDGYNGSFDDYKKLVKEDTEALDYSYKLFSSDGYDGAIEDFTKLLTTEPAKTKAVATDPAPVTAVKKADTDSTSESGSSALQKSDNNVETAMFNYEARTGSKANSVMDLTDEDYEEGAFLKKFKQPKAVDIFKANRDKIKSLEDKRKELEKKATTYSYNNFGATQESVDYIEEQLKDFDNLVLEPEVRLMESNPEFKLQNQAIAQLSKDTGNNQATGDSVDDLASEFSILNTFRGKSYYKNIEADETIKLNEDVEAAVVGELSQRSLEKLAGGFYTLQEKENLIRSVKIPLIKQRSKEVTSKIEQQKTIVESEVESQLSTETKIRKSLKALDKTNPKEIAEYNLLVNTYNKSKEKLKSKIENFESSRKKLISEYDSYQGELGVDYANNVIRNSFEISNDVDAFREKYAGEGFWNGTADIVGGDIIQGLYQTVKKATVGSGSWILTSFSDAFQDQESYSSYDAFSDVVNNWSTKTLVPSSTDEKFSITKEEGGFKDAKDLSTRNFLKLGGSMVPFTTYLISEVRKGNYKGVKQALGDTYLKFGNKGKVLKDASQQLKNNIIMADATFRATIMDNQKVAESKGLNGIQASAYATAISTTEAAVQSIMPDSNFLKGIEGKAIKDAFIGSLKKVATKEGAKAASKEFVVNLGKELLEEEANFAGNLLTDISFGLALPKSSEFLNQQIDLVTGTLMLSSGMGSIGAVKTFNNQKTLIYSQINKNLGSLELQLTEMHSKVSDEDTKDQIYNAIVFARDISKAIDKSPKNVTADQIDLLVKKQKLIDTKKEKDLVFHEEINNKIASIDSRIKESAVKRDVISKVDKDIANIDKSMASSGFEIEKTIVLDDDASSTSSEKFYDILVKGSKPKGFKGTIEDFANANKNNLGGFITDAKGNETLVINRAEAINKSVITTGQHEFLHKLLRYTFDKSSIKQAASLLESMVDKMPKDQGVEYKNRLEVYKKDLESGALTADAFYEEYLTLLSEAITNEDVSTDKSIIGKVKDFFRRKGEDQGLNIDFKKGEEGVINFVKDYNRAFAKGKFNKQKQTTKNVKANTFSASKIADIEGKIEALQDKYDDGLLDYDDYEQQLDNLESKLEKAKSAPVEEKVVSKPKTKEVKENTEEVIKKASDKVFKGDEVSDRNKGISKINEDIANEMLELGANSISDIKDPAKRKAIVDKLGKNNLGAVTNLTKKAAAVGKDLAIDSNLKVGYDEFFSGFSEELSALIQTYKVKVDDKKVPFGAYMNKNLSLRYGQILDKALKGRVQNAQSLDVESGSVGSVKEIAAEGSRDFDAYTSADKGLPAGELIDVTNFKNVKDRVEAVRDVINLEGVDVADLTYKKVVDDYAGVTGAEVIGLHNKNAEPEKGQDKNDFQKLAERIDGTRTLNYGKGVNGEAEVRAMQKLFIDYNDMVKFIKTIPEFNVAPFETTIDKQGRSIDLTADAKGYSVGTSNVLLKELYDIYIDPKSKSADKATKTRSITSPSGRGKGKTSQVAKVYRLKDKYRGRIDRKTVKELQKTIGITEAGEAFIPMKGVNRTKFGTALQGLTKIYAANVANTVIRKDIVDKGTTSDKKSTEKVLADIGGGKSSVMFSKNVELVRSEKVYKKFEKDLKGFKLYHGGEIVTSEDSNITKRNMLTWFWVNDLDGALAHNQDDTSVPIYEVKFDDISSNKVIVPDFEYMPYTIIKEAVEKVYHKGYKPAVVLKEGIKESGDEMDNFSAPSVMSDPKANEIIKEFLDWSYKNNEAYEYNFGIPFIENGKIAEGLPVIVVGEISSSNIKQVNKSSENTGVLFSLNVPKTSSLTELLINRAVAYVQPKTKKGKPTNRIGKKILNEIITGLLYTESYEGRNEFIKARDVLKNPFQKEIVDYVFEGKEWMFGLFSDEQAFLNNGIKYEKLIRRAIKELKLKDVSIDLSQGGFGSGVDLVLSIKGKDINIELKLNENAQFGSFSIKEENGKYVYTEGINGLKEKIPDLDTKIQEELNSESYQENYKAFKEEALNNGGKLDESGRLTGPRKMFEDLVKNEFLKKLNININKDSKGEKLDEKIINLIYNNKDVYNIEIGGKGLYYLGENKDNMPIPKLESDTSLMIRQTYNQLGKSGIYTLVNRAFLMLDSNIVESNINFSDLDNIKEAVETLTVTFSKGLSNTFNEIIENKTGIKADDTISQVKAKMLANSKRKFNIFVPPSAEDFVGLLYATLGKGKIGDRQMKFYDRTLLKPYARAMQAITKDRLDLGRSFKKIKKEFKTTPKDLKKKIPGSLFNKEQAVRIYIWDSIGQEVPGLSVEEVNELANYVADNENLKEFAEQVIRLNPGSKYLSPKEGWETGNITTDLLETLNESRRAKHLERWQQNVDDIFSNENLNKLEAAYGTSYRKSVENILTRMKTGRNRTYGTDSQTAAWIEWINGSVGAIMFFNTRSAVLQTLSATNFINFGDNNIFAAGKAFANQKQYWSDFAKLMSSDYLLERRDSLKINVNEADIAEAAKQNGVRGAINYLLKLGFTPTKFADSFAIASGGSTFYRNRLNALIKKGMDPVAAEKAAMRDFIEISEESQQSSRPDKISQEQAGPLGRIILAFANTPAQYTRKIKKAALDLKNGRGDAKVNISRIIYYGFAQNLIFTTLQQGLFALAFGDEEENEKLFDDKKLDAVNSMLDTFIRGSGVTGSVVSVLKNVGLRIYKESEKERPKYENTANELLKISPPISSKFNKITAAGKTFSWDMDDIKEKGFDVTNPAIGAGAKVVSAFTNLPLDRVVRKVENLTAASNAELETYKRIALTLGWSKWELGIKDPKKKKKKSSGIKGYKIKNYKIKF